MKVIEHPMLRHCLIKDFNDTRIMCFSDLTEEQKEYEIVETFIKTILGREERVYVIASSEMMKEWNLNPINYHFSSLRVFTRRF